MVVGLACVGGGRGGGGEGGEGGKGGGVSWGGGGGGGRDLGMSIYARGSGVHI